ncbi:2OG-Fe(II) oxygenase family protein [Blastomonas sp.]|uniref:2OG-Fe(II) oxygenase n=1 Tax=Blastomonas sp. TaxID=1909299 RepID=UPI00261DE208|nr:2OG-Fe(II) oxygenase family protein [Blastomonas sp.]MDM7955532.1 2OG-Fe(II) oxygenase family protein [Blastomonas sp.]
MSSVTRAPLHLLELNPELDRQALAQAFAVDRRLQIRNVLKPEAARELRHILAQHTPWGLAWNAGADGPHGLRPDEMSALPPFDQQRIAESVVGAAQRGDYAFTFARYPILDAYLGRWAPDSPHDILLEHINDQPFLDLIRSVTGIGELIKADAQATQFGPSQFLGKHSDSHVGEGWRIAYVLSLAPDDWKPDWGGYLNFLDEDGDIIVGYRPRFNSLSLFAVPQDHLVSYVPPFAPMGRLSITGWFRDR